MSTALHAIRLQTLRADLEIVRVYGEGHDLTTTNSLIEDIDVALSNIEIMAKKGAASADAPSEDTPPAKKGAKKKAAAAKSAATKKADPAPQLEDDGDDELSHEEVKAMALKAVKAGANRKDLKNLTKSYGGDRISDLDQEGLRNLKADLEAFFEESE